MIERKERRNLSRWIIVSVFAFIFLLGVFAIYITGQPSGGPLARRAISRLEIKTPMEHERVVEPPVANRASSTERVLSVQEPGQQSEAGVGPAVSPAPIGFDGTDRRLGPQKAIIPTGTVVAAVLQNTIVSLNFETPVRVRILQNIRSPRDSSLALPAGSIGLGYASKAPVRDRIRVQISRIVFPNGAEAQLKGLALSLDGSSGLVGRVYSNTGAFLLGEIILSFSSAFTRSMKNFLVTNSGEVADIPDLKNASLEGLAAVADKAAQKIAEDKQSQEEYIVVPGGLPIFIYLTEGVFQWNV